MTILARIVRFLFWLLVLTWSVQLLRRLFGSSSQPTAKGTASSLPPATAHRLVRDPVCGMHVDEALSIPMLEDGRLLHFCSIACRDAYVVGSKKFAANG